MPFPVENIREACKDKGTTIAEVERALGIGNGVIGKWENGKKSPPIDRIISLAEFLGVPLQQLVYGKQKPAIDYGGLTSEEIEVIRLFRNAHPAARALIVNLLRSAEFGQSFPGDGEADK